MWHVLYRKLGTWVKSMCVEINKLEKMFQISEDLAALLYYTETTIQTCTYEEEKMIHKQLDTSKAIVDHSQFNDPIPVI